MIKRYQLFLIAVLLIGGTAFGQNDFVSIINGHIEEVNTSKYVFKQNMELIGDEGKAKLEVTTIDSKGRRKATEFVFNFRDLSERGISYKVDRDVIKINVLTADKNKFIAEREEGEPSGYSSDFLIYNRDYDKTKEIITNMKELMAFFANVVPSNSPPSKLEGIQDWLVTNIKGFRNEKDNITQSISFDPERKLSATFTVKSANSKGEDIEFYTFNMADLNADYISIGVKSNKFVLELLTKSSSKYISYNENGEYGNNLKELEFWSDDLELMKLWKEAFQKAIPLADTLLEHNKIDINSSSTAQSYIKISQNASFDKNCNCTIDFKEKDLPRQYKFNLFDADDYSIEKSVSGNQYEVEFKTKSGKDYIAILEDEVPIDFTNKAVVASTDLESFRQMEESLKFLIKECQENYVPFVKEGDIKERLNWIAAAIPNYQNDVTKIEQKFTYNNEEPCKMNFSVKVNKEGKESSNSYELKGYLLDTYTSGVDVSGSNVNLLLQSIDKGKVFESFENGQPDNFVSSVKIRIDDLEKAKSINETFKTIINDCK